MFKRVLAVLVLVAASVIGVAGTAGADEVGSRVGEACERGEFCLWPRESYRGPIHRVSLVTTNPGECLPLAGELDARSFANRTSRQVTVYQGRECSTEGEFDTYPGGGTYVPVAPYVVRGVQIWEG